MSETRADGEVKHKTDCDCDACTEDVMKVLMANLCWNPDPFCGCSKHSRTAKEVRQ